MGESGELVIGGVGLARYLDTEQGRREVRAAAVAGLGARLPQRRPRARRRGRAAVPRPRRRAGQARRAADRAGRGRRRAAGAARRARRRGGRAPHPRGQPGAGRLRGGRATACRHRRRGARLCATGCRPRWCRCSRWSTTLPTRTSGKVDRDALPWPLPAGGLDPVGGGPADPDRGLAGRGLGGDPRRAGRPTRRPTSSPTAAAASPPRSWWRGSAPGTRRCRSTTSTSNPKLGALADPAGRGRARPPRRGARSCRRRGAPALAQALLMVPMLALVGPALGERRAPRSRRSPRSRCPGRPPCPGGGSRWPGWCCSARPGGSRIAAGGARLLLRGVRPGSYPRGGAVHLRLWAADRLAELSAARPASPAPRWTTRYARALGAKIGQDVDLHSAAAGHRPAQARPRRGGRARGRPRPATGSTATSCTSARSGSAPGATVGARSTLLPGARIGKGAEIAAGLDRARRRPRRSALGGRARAAESARAARSWPADPAAALARAGRSPTASPSMLLGLLPAVAALPALADRRRRGRRHGVPRGGGAAPRCSLVAARDARLPGWPTRCSSWPGCALLSIGLRAGFHPVHGRIGLAGLDHRAPDGHGPHRACSRCTPACSRRSWLRLLGATVGRDVEASTVLALPAMTTVADGAFLADDTMVAHLRARPRLAARRPGARSASRRSSATPG